MDQKKKHVEVVVAVEVAVAAGGSKANVAEILNRAVSEVVVGEGVAVEAGSAGIAAAVSKAAADLETFAVSKSTSIALLLVAAVHSLLLSWRSPSTVARH